MKTICCSCAWLGVLGFSAVAADEPAAPSQQHEPELQPGGIRDLGRFEDATIDYGRRRNDWKVPHGNLRQFYDLAGLPKAGEDVFRPGHEKLQYHPHSVRKRYQPNIQWESWRIHLRREQITWTAAISRAAPNSIFHSRNGDLEVNKQYQSAWVIDPQQHQPEVGWDGSLLGEEKFRTCGQPILSGARSIQLLNWSMGRRGARYFTPRLKLSDLKHLAPWFYEHIPPYVLQREEWFHHWEMRSMAVYIDRSGRPSHQVGPESPRMIELYGRFSFEGQAKDKQFDTYFSPATFRRFHVRGEYSQNATNFARPSRESDVLVLDGAHAEFRIRFMASRRKSADGN